MEKKNSTASPLLPLSLPLQSFTPPFSLLYNHHLATFHEQTHSKVVVLETVWRATISFLPLAADRQLCLWLAASPASQLSSILRPAEQELLHWHSFQARAREVPVVTAAQGAHPEPDLNTRRVENSLFLLGKTISGLMSQKWITS